jgi:hypothetical protein
MNVVPNDNQRAPGCGMANDSGRSGKGAEKWREMRLQARLILYWRRGFVKE